MCKDLSSLRHSGHPDFSFPSSDFLCFFFHFFDLLTQPPETSGFWNFESFFRLRFVLHKEVCKAGHSGRDFRFVLRSGCSKDIARNNSNRVLRAQSFQFPHLRDPGSRQFPLGKAPWPLPHGKPPVPLKALRFLSRSPSSAYLHGSEDPETVRG